MSSVEDRADRYRECAGARLALPPHPGPVTAGMTADLITLAVGANRVTLPPDALKVVDCLLLGLEILEDFD